MLKAEDFTYTCNGVGYKLYYKNRLISIIGIDISRRERKSHWKSVVKDIKQYQKEAEIVIHQLVKGVYCCVSKSIIDKIKMIDSEDNNEISTIR